MAGTLTVTLVEGDPVKDSGIAAEKVQVGEVLQYKSGSVDYVEKFDKTETIQQGELMVAAEFGTVQYDGSYEATELVHYYKPQRGDVIYGEIHGTKSGTNITQGDYLGLANHTAGALDIVGEANGTVAKAMEDSGTTNNTVGVRVKYEVL